VAFIIIQLCGLGTEMLWAQEVLWMTGDTRKADPGNVDINVQTYEPAKEESGIQDLLGGPGSRGGEQPKPPVDEDPLQRMLREQEKK